MATIDSNNGTKVVVIGGGTGSFTLLSELKNHYKYITALVNMADDGGSTGVLRDEFGVLPPGDIRQCLVALSRSPEVRDLFNYRFEDGSLKGHAFGNLFLTALEKITGDFAAGVKTAGRVLNVKGRVEPVTLTDVHLVMQDENNKKVHGEFRIAHEDFNSHRPTMWLEPEPVINPNAKEAIEAADIVIIAPGNLYGSLAPALLVPGIGEALKKSSALKVYVCNLVTKPGQTDGFSVVDFADEIERMAGEKFLDKVIYNTKQPSKDLLDKYAADGEKAVLSRGKNKDKRHYELVGVDALADKIWQNKNSKSDPIASRRTLIRHDAEAIAVEVGRIYRAFVKNR